MPRVVSGSLKPSALRALLNSLASADIFTDAPEHQAQIGELKREARTYAVLLADVQGARSNDPLTAAEGKAAWSRCAAVLNAFGVRGTLITIGKLLHFACIQEFASMNDVPQLEADIINLACKYASRDERGETAFEDDSSSTEHFR